MAGETPGSPRFQGRARYGSFTYPQYGAHGGVVLDGGVLSLSKIGRSPLRLHRPLEGTPKTVTLSRAADGWYASSSCAEVPTQPVPLTGRETGIDVGLKVFLITADGEAAENPRHYSPLPEGGKAACQGAAAGKPPEEGEQAPEESCGAMRQAASARAQAADRLPAQDGARSAENL